MDIVDYLHRLFAYDDWANREVLAALRNAPNPPARSLKLIAHILSAEGLWLARINQEKPSLPVWPELALAQCEAEGDALRASWPRHYPLCISSWPDCQRHARRRPHSRLYGLHPRHPAGAREVNNGEDKRLHGIPGFPNVCRVDSDFAGCLSPPALECRTMDGSRHRCSRCRAAVRSSLAVGQVIFQSRPRLVSLSPRGCTRKFAIPSTCSAP